MLLYASFSEDTKQALTFETEINRWLSKSISYHDGYENFYHGFLVGLLEYSDDYEVLSNRENGTGRSDIVIKDIITYKKAVIIEIKSVREKNCETLDGQCSEALKQIEDKQYEVNLKNEGYTDIVKYGIAFQEKSAESKKPINEKVSPKMDLSAMQNTSRQRYKCCC